MRQTSWTWEAYLDWEARQPICYELVDGKVHAMGGGTAEHDTIATIYAASCARSCEASRAGRMARTSRCEREGMSSGLTREQPLSGRAD